jgi:hypothetical protein
MEQIDVIFLKQNSRRPVIYESVLQFSAAANQTTTRLTAT